MKHLQSIGINNVEYKYSIGIYGGMIWVRMEVQGGVARLSDAVTFPCTTADSLAQRRSNAGRAG